MKHKLITATAVVAVLATPAGITAANNAGPIDPNDPDVIAIDLTVTGSADFHMLCADMPDLAWDLYMSDAFAVGEEDLAADMLVAYFVEEFENGFGSNLSEHGEAHLVDLLHGCIAS